MKYIYGILECPKCGYRKEEQISKINDMIRYRGHWWSCPNDCTWNEDEYNLRHGAYDSHVYLELIDVYEKEV